MLLSQRGVHDAAAVEAANDAPKTTASEDRSEGRARTGATGSRGMSTVVLSIGSNLGDRLGRLQSVVDGLDGAVRAVSPVYETPAWGGVEQGPFLNAVLIADDPAMDSRDWLCRAHELEAVAERVREQRWGPRTLD